LKSTILLISTYSSPAESKLNMLTVTLGLGEENENPDLRILKGILRLFSRIEKLSYDSKGSTLQVDWADQICSVFTTYMYSVPLRRILSHISHCCLTYLQDTIVYYDVIVCIFFLSFMVKQSIIWLSCLKCQFSWLSLLFV